MRLNLTARLFLLASALLLSAAPSPAFAGFFSSDGEEDETPWVEIEAQLPAFPEPENRIPFTVGAMSDTQFFIDSPSLSVDADGVIRYSLLIISSAGAQTISYEGMRCLTTERRMYAFGRADKTWSPAHNKQWVKVSGSSNNPHVELFFNYFCAHSAPTIQSADEARRVLRTGGWSKR